MSHVLHVNASPMGEQSVSRSIACAFLDAYRERQSNIQVDTIDLFEEQLPKFGIVAAQAKSAMWMGAELTAEQQQVWTELHTLFGRFAAADTYVFNIPMWNHSVPYVLKHMIDIVTQPSWAFTFDPEHGYIGQMAGKKALVVYTSGVNTPGGPISFGVDFQSPFFKDWLRFIGITNVTEIAVRGHVLDPDGEESVERSKKAARELATTF